MSLQSGNAAVERSLSDNKNTVTDERCQISNEALVGLRRMKEVARDVDGAARVRTTSKEIQTSMKSAHKKYEDRKAQEEAERKMKM